MQFSKYRHLKFNEKEGSSIIIINPFKAS